MVSPVLCHGAMSKYVPGLGLVFVMSRPASDWVTGRTDRGEPRVAAAATERCRRER